MYNSPQKETRGFPFSERHHFCLVVTGKISGILRIQPVLHQDLPAFFLHENIRSISLKELNGKKNMGLDFFFFKTFLLRYNGQQRGM